LELRELGDLKGLEGVDVIVDPADVDISDEEVEAAGKTQRNNLKVLRGYAENEPTPGNRRIVFKFRTSPIEIRGDGLVEEVVLGRNELAADENGRVVAKDTGVREELPAQLVVRAVGYRGVPTPGLPFDEQTGTIPHTDGRVQGSRNEYVVGWIKRGPTGVIGSNKSDSQHTVDTLAADLADAPHDEGYAGELLEWLLSRQPKLITDEHWQLIDRHERSTGEPHGRPRVKLASVADMLRIGHR
jgi:ferredoxin--NADP+ reductase